jgi:hypothetical protein
MIVPVDIVAVQCNQNNSLFVTTGVDYDSPGLSLAAAAGATAVSFIPALTDWVRLITALIGLLCACYGAYRLFRSK